ncbi:MAG: alpha-galactosidase [Lentisphaeria bacterium]
MTEQRDQTAKSAACELNAGGYSFTFRAHTPDVVPKAKLLQTGTEGVYEIEFTATAKNPVPPPLLTVDWQHPMVDTHLRWITKRPGALPIMPWKGAATVQAKGTSNAPVYGLMSIDDTNQLTFAISDAVNPAALRAQMSEETAILNCCVEIPARTSPTQKKHSFRLRVDTRTVRYEEALHDVSDWWTSFDAYAPMPVPEKARLPMYSTWYSFHLGITPDAIEEQCRMAKELGMDSVIVDDGWQTEVTQRGYAWCGDWEPAPGKFPDLAGHVKRVQDIGMKYLLWFSVPFVGIHSKASERFKDCLLPNNNPDAQWWCLDPRCDAVREYLIGIYEHYVRDIGVDGLKLDFVDAFSEPAPGESLPEDAAPRRDVTVAEAGASLLAEVADRLRAINPEVMLEFRQSYIGPAMRRCGNIFRVGDVPNDFHSNHIHALDLRLLSGNTAVHSDMIMWHPKDSVESAAMQLLHTLFAVPQISVMIDQLPRNHRAMLTAYLKFWCEHRELLLDGRLTSLQPGMNYPQVQAALGSKWLSAVYSNTVVLLPATMPKQLIFVNGTLASTVCIKIPAGVNETRRLRVVDCEGKNLKEASLPLQPGLQEIEIPPAGVAYIEFQE